MSQLRDKAKKILPGFLFRFLLQIYRFRLCFKYAFSPIGPYTISKMLFLEYIRYQKPIFLRKQQIYVHCNYFTLTTLLEIYNIQLYKQLHGLNCVLDAGSYIGESSLYLIQHNKKVISVEAASDKYNLLEKNISNQKENIIGINKALVGSSKKYLDLYSSEAYDFCSSLIPQEELSQKERVEAIHVDDIATEYGCDGIKMDIEGGEYDIITFYLENPEKFRFKKGIIEFHFAVETESRMKIFYTFITFLQESSYDIQLYDNYNKEIPLQQTQQENITCINLYFTNEKTTTN